MPIGARTYIQWSACTYMQKQWQLWVAPEGEATCFEFHTFFNTLLLSSDRALPVKGSLLMNDCVFSKLHQRYTEIKQLKNKLERFPMLHSYMRDF